MNIANSDMDCDVLETAACDQEQLGSLAGIPWLVQLWDGYMLAFDDEKAARAFQREWRKRVGLNPMTGEPNAAR